MVSVWGMAGQRRLETVCQGPGLSVSHQSTSHPRTLTSLQPYTAQRSHRHEKTWPIRMAINAHIKYLAVSQSEAQESNEILASLVNSLFATFWNMQYNKCTIVTQRIPDTALLLLSIYYIHSAQHWHWKQQWHGSKLLIVVIYHSFDINMKLHTVSVLLQGHQRIL